MRPRWPCCRLLATLRTRLAALPSGQPPPRLVFFQRDEVMVEAPEEFAEDVMATVAEAGAEATRLVLGRCGVRVPLQARALTCYADKGAVRNSASTLRGTRSAPGGVSNHVLK